VYRYDMRDAVEGESRRRLVEAAAPSHPPFRVLVDALTAHAARDNGGKGAAVPPDEEETTGGGRAAARISPEVGLYKSNPVYP
jgi:hypothetical protein